MVPRSTLALLLLLLIVFLSSHTHTSSALVASAAEDAGPDDDTAPYDDDDTQDDDDITEDDLADGDDSIDMPPDDDGEEEDDESNDDEDDASASDPNKPAVLDPEGEENATGYTPPSVPNAAFFDDFQSGLAKWTHTKDPEYAGEFKIGQGASPVYKGDRALIIPEKAKRYGLSAEVTGMDDVAKKDVVLQYEVKLDQGMSCGGAYLKLPTGHFDPAAFNGATPYSVMFGPDKCGSTDKIHFIFQSKNPVTGKTTEHHMKEPPSVANTYDKKTHLYTLNVKADGKFEVLVDNELKKDGTLSDNFEPPVQPEKEIDDPEDKKPGDWVDEAKIPDPEATKPDDWDEDAPKKIEDVDAEKPKGWLDDEPTEIPDPDANKPDEWDDEEDGEWEAPLVPNPKCEEIGCGEWKRPMKDNPDYKGKWESPMIDNPKYIGTWKPRKIANKEYYDASSPSLLPINGVGIEIWTMDQGVLFDNVLLGSDVQAAKRYAERTFAEKQKIELREAEDTKKAKESSKKSKKPGQSKLGPVMDKVEEAIDWIDAKLEPVQDFLVDKGAEPYLDKLIDAGVQKPMLVVASFPLIIVLVFLIILGGGRKKPTAEEAAAEEVAARKKTDEPTPDAQASTTESVADSAATEAEPEKFGVRKRRTATAE